MNENYKKDMNKSTIKDILVRYGIATIGLLLVAIGVALSIKSDLGTAPISCPPYVASLIGGLTVGQYTILMHFFFVLFQIVLLGKRFKMENLMQIAAAFVFGFLTDASIWALDWINVSSYLGKFSLLLLSCAITAAGISIEVRSKAWMLAGEMTVAALADVWYYPFRNVKIVFDFALVLLSAAASVIAFNRFLGTDDTVVIREGTFISAILTGFLMRFFEPLTEKIFGKTLDSAGAKAE